MIDYVWTGGVASRIAEPFATRGHIATNNTSRVRNPTIPTCVLSKIRFPVLKSLHVIGRLLKTQTSHPLHNLTSTSGTIVVIRSSLRGRWSGSKRIGVTVMIVVVMVIRGRRSGARIGGSGRSHCCGGVHRERIGGCGPWDRGAKFRVGVEIGLSLGVEFKEGVSVRPRVRLRRRFEEVILLRIHRTNFNYFLCDFLIEKLGLGFLSRERDEEREREWKWGELCVCMLLCCFNFMCWRYGVERDRERAREECGGNV